MSWNASDPGTTLVWNFTENYLTKTLLEKLLSPMEPLQDMNKYKTNS